jgi:hypothetical protein
MAAAETAGAHETGLEAVGRRENLEIATNFFPDEPRLRLALRKLSAA